MNSHDLEKNFEQARLDTRFHLGLGDIRVTLGWQEEIVEAMRAKDEEIERLKSLLKEARDDISDCAADSRGRRSLYSSEQRRYKKHMDIVNRIDAALAGKDKI